MNVLTLTTPDIENGIGCRVTMWVAGCSHHCEGCHNKHTWDYKQGTNLTSNSVWDKVVEACDHDYIDGLTVCGGDPLDQDKKSLKDLAEWLKKFRQRFPNKNVWIYAGDTYEEILKDKEKLNVIKQCDVLVDGPFVAKLHDQELAFRGSSNQRIIDLKQTFEGGYIVEINIK